MARPKGGSKPQTQKRCAYQNGNDRCMKWTVGTGQFCAQHALPLPAAQAVEANALGAEKAAALREELGVPPVVEHLETIRVPIVEKVMTKDEATFRPAKGEPDRVVEGLNSSTPSREQPAMPAAAVKDPIKYAMQLALDSVARAYAADNEERAKTRNPGQRINPTERARMYLQGYIPEFDDAAAMVGRNGEPLVKPGWIPRWVRDKDEDGRPNTRRYRMFLSMGCEDVLDTDGRPLVGRLGRAIQMPPEVYAARVLKESPSGAFDSSPYVQGAMEMAETLNRGMGRKVVDVRPASDHGSHW